MTMIERVARAIVKAYGGELAKGAPPGFATVEIDPAVLARAAIEAMLAAQKEGLTYDSR